MIARLEQRQASQAGAIHRVLQAAYLAEAAILGVAHFPPLARSAVDIAGSDSLYFGYLEENLLLGVIELEQVPDHPLIASLGVLPGAFRRGIGRALVLHAVGHAGEALRVATGAANLPAIRLYEALGFGIRRRYATPDGVAMVELARGG